VNPSHPKSLACKVEFVEHLLSEIFHPVEGIGWAGSPAFPPNGPTQG
jgi:hypothetical protein